MSLLDTDSDLDGSTSEDSMSSSQPTNLPDFDTFLSRLHHVDTNTVVPDDECPICRVPYLTSLAEHCHEQLQHLDHQRSQTFEALPFHYTNPQDGIGRPVRLPCAAGHLVGRACVIDWASHGGGTACPLDREPLFQRLSRAPSPQYFTSTIRFDRGVREIGRMPIRSLLRRFRAVTEADTLRVDARAMVEGLTPLLFRVVYHRAGFYQSHPVIQWPCLRGAATLLSWQQAPRFRRFVRRFVRDEPLEANGQYEEHVRELLSPVLPHVFALLYRLAEHYRNRMIGAAEFAGLMRRRVERFFEDFAHLITEEGRVLAVAVMTVELWVAQSLLVTELGRETGQPFYRGDRVGEGAGRLGNRTDSNLATAEAPVGYVNGPGWNRNVRYSRPPTLSIASSTWHGHAQLQRPQRAVLADSERTEENQGTSGPEVVHVPDQVFAALWESTRGPSGLIDPSRPPESPNSDAEDVISRIIVPQGELTTPVLADGSTEAAPQDAVDVQRNLLYRRLMLNYYRGFVLGEVLEGREGPVILEDGSVLRPGTHSERLPDTAQR